MRTKFNPSRSTNQKILEKLKALRSWWDDPLTSEAAELGMLMAAVAGQFLAAGKPCSTADAAVILKGASKETGIPVEALATYAEGIRLMLEESGTLKRDLTKHQQQISGSKL